MESNVARDLARPKNSWLNTATLAWASWDWGQAAINAVMTTFVFTVYLTSELFGSTDHASVVLGQALTVAGVAAVLRPRLTELLAFAPYEQSPDVGAPRPEPGRERRISYGLSPIG